jgi:hypothetical protein
MRPSINAMVVVVEREVIYSLRVKDLNNFRIVRIRADDLLSI